MQPAESKQSTAVNSRQTLQGTDMKDIKELAAPSSEEVKRIVGDTFEASMSYQSGEIGPITLRQENAIRVVVWDSVNAVLAARVPDGCVVVPIADLKNAAGSYEEGDGQSCVQILNRLIAAGEVKP